MTGVTLVETETLQALISKVEHLEATVVGTIAQLSDSKKPYLNSSEVMEITGFSKNWLNGNKQDIGFSMVGGELRFKRKDLEEYMSQNYFKTKKPKRSW